jgi:phytol kinase
MAVGGEEDEAATPTDVDLKAAAEEPEQPDVETGTARCGCGFPPDTREDLTTPWEVQEKWCFLIPAFLGFVAVVSLAIHAAAPEDLPWMAPPPPAEFIAGIVIGALAINLIFGFIGLFVVHCGMPVAVSRKIMHILIVGVVPLIVVSTTTNDKPLAEKMWGASVWQSLAASIGNLSMMKPMRRLPYVGALPRTAFAAIDRPEDRPLTLIWVMAQLVAMTVVETPMMYWLIENDVGSLRMLCPFAVGLGDGLAEPIGKRFGKHKYQVYALFTKQRFTRSYEGSANVFFWTLVGVLIAIPELSLAQVIFLVLLLPPAMTLTEAKSPHTLDNMFMFGTAWVFTAIALEIKM